MRETLAAVVALLAAAGACPGSESAAPQEIFAAIRNNELVRLQSLIGPGSNVNARGDCGATPPMYAAAYGSLDALKMLLDAGADVNAISAKDPVSVKRGPIDLGYYTPLMLAAVYGPSQIVDLLLRAGASVDAADIRGRTPLHFAVSTEAQTPEIVRLLLKAGAKPAAKDLGGESTADWAAKYSVPAVMRLLAPSRAAMRVRPGEPAPGSAPPPPRRSTLCCHRCGPHSTAACN